MTIVVQVFFHDPNRKVGGRPFENIELDFDTFDDFCDALAGDGLVRGSILNTQGGVANQRIVTSRTPIAFAGVSVARLQAAYVDFIDQCDAV